MAMEMVRKLKSALLILFLIPVSGIAQELVSRDTTLMGTYFSISVQHKDPVYANKVISKAFMQIWLIENQISSWIQGSYTDNINKASGKAAVEVPKSLYQLIERSIKISELTDGAFDISVATLGWDLQLKASNPSLPDDLTMSESKSMMGYQYIQLIDSNYSVFLQKPGMRIGFGGIGKGYAAQEAMKVIIEMGIDNALINAGGDLLCKGEESDGQPWWIAIAEPDGSRKGKAYLNISNLSVVTSGDYERFVEIDGKRYSHIIDPRTGMPSESGIKSVTIISPDAEYSDALATAVFVLGTEKGLELIQKLKNTEAIFITSEDEIISSKGIKLKFKEAENKNIQSVIGAGE